MSSVRIFLGWDGPFLERAAELLLDRSPTGEMIDLRHYTLVLPGRRAERRLLELMVDRAAQLQKILVPPAIVSVGGLPELLYSPDLPLADDLQELLAWAEVVRSAADEELLLVCPQLIASRSTADVLTFAEKLQRLWAQELSAAQKRFADVGIAGSSMEYFTADATWETLEIFHKRYLEVLSSQGVHDRYEARYLAAENNKCTFEGTLFLIGIVDLKPATAALVRQLECEVTILINAPEQLNEGFDELGTLIFGQWQKTPLTVEESQLTIVDSPDDQADEVLRYLAEQSPTRNVEEIVVGVPDEEVVPYLARRLETSGLHARRAAGIPAKETPLVTLLTLAHAYLSEPKYSRLSALLRHPDVERTIVSRLSDATPSEGLLTSLSATYIAHLQQDLSEELLLLEESSAITQAALDLFGPLHSGSASVGVSAWIDALCASLAEIYDHSLLTLTAAPSDPLLLPSSKALRQVLDSLNARQQELAEWTGSELFALTLRLLAKMTIAEESNDTFVELLGWLELSLDDAELCVVTGMNEGFVPESVTADDLLPNSLRSRLGLLDNNRRYARDCYAMSVLLHSKPLLHFICGRRSLEGNALLPSRLLMQTDGDTLLQRLLRFHNEEAAPAPVNPEQFQARASSPLLQPRKPQPLPTPITGLSATSFRDYISCPYRYYLKHVLGLESMDDSLQEMDGAHFGNLAHAVLATLEPGSSLALSTNPNELHNLLSTALDAHVRQVYGKVPLPAVKIQIEMLRLRLRAFAEWQTERVRDGWQILEVEYAAGKLGKKIELADGFQMALHGRIDRIDFHPHQGFQIIDYKTSEKAGSPDKMHRKSNGEWIDLQLPCYWEMYQSKIGTQQCALGYLQLAPNVDAFTFESLTWGEEAIADARAVMKQIAEDIHVEKFWPPASSGPSYDMFEEVLAHFSGDLPEDAEEQE